MTIDCTKQKPDINDLPKDIQRQLYTVIKFKWTLNNTKGLIMKTKILMLSFALSLGISTGASAISPCLAEFMRVLKEMLVQMKECAKLSLKSVQDTKLI